MYLPHEVRITPEMIQKATERDKGKYNNRSFMDGKGNFVGFLGEYITQYIRPELIHVDSFNYDFLLGKKKIDVKTKYQTIAYAPKGYYEASVDVNSMHQETDYYIFCRIYREEHLIDGKTEYKYPYGWVLGGISKESFLKESRKLIKGELDGDNGYIVKQDCYNIRYDQLKPIKVTRKDD